MQMFLPKINFPKNKTPSGRHMFTKEEDTYLKFLVSVFGTSQWEVVASMIGNRTARQCRERYKNYLSPSINNSPWTPEEDVVLLTKYSQLGPKWSQISTFFNGRTDVMVKNRYSTLTSKNITQTNTAPNQSYDLPDNVNELLKSHPPPMTTFNGNLSSASSTANFTSFSGSNTFANAAINGIRPQALSSSSSCHPLPPMMHCSSHQPSCFNYNFNINNCNSYNSIHNIQKAQQGHQFNFNIPNKIPAFPNNSSEGTNQNSNVIPKTTNTEIEETKFTFNEITENGEMSEEEEYFNAVELAQSIHPIKTETHQTKEPEVDIFEMFDSNFNEFEFVL